MLLGGLILAQCADEVAGVGTPTVVITGATAIGVTSTMWLVGRGFQTVDVIAGAVETNVKMVIDRVGEESSKIVPVIIAMVITLLLIVVHQLVQKFWWMSPKQWMFKSGANPEGNMASLQDGRSLPRIKWLSRALISRVVANHTDAVALASDSNRNYVKRIKDSSHCFNFEMTGQTTKKTYVVRLLSLIHI